MGDTPDRSHLEPTPTVETRADGKVIPTTRHMNPDKGAKVTSETRKRAKLAGGALGGVLDDAGEPDAPAPSPTVNLTGPNAAEKRAKVAAYLDNLPDDRKIEIQGDRLRDPQVLMTRDGPGLGRRYTGIVGSWNEFLPRDGRGNSSAMKESLDNWDATSVRVLNPEPDDPPMPFTEPKTRTGIAVHPDNFYNGETMDQIDGADWEDASDLYSPTVTVDGEERPRRWAPWSRVLAGCVAEDDRRPDEHDTFYAVVHDGTSPPAELLYHYMEPKPERFEHMDWEEIRDEVEQGYADSGGVAWVKREVYNESSDFYNDMSMENRGIPGEGVAMPFSMMDPSVQRTVKEGALGYQSTHNGHIVNYNESRDDWEVQLEGPPYGQTERWPPPDWVHPEDR